MTVVLESIIIALIGIISGGIVNALADNLPYRHNLGLPTYADGTPRPIIAWLGITAFIFRQQQPQHATHTYLSLRHPITELLASLLMVITYHRLSQDTSTLQMTIWLFYIALLILIAIIDLEHQRIMFIYTIPSALVAIIDAAFIHGGTSLQSALIGGTFGFIVFYIFFQGGFLFTYIMGRLRGQKIDTIAFGFGDVMLITLCGLIVGLDGVIIVMLMTVFLGAIGAIVYIGLRLLVAGRYTLFTPLPYGQYIVISTIIVFLFRANIRLLLLGY